jgi:AraC-like DNA-binding protein/CheY-like chemotaxis protein
MTKLLVLAESSEQRDQLLADLKAAGFDTFTTESGYRGVQYACQLLPSAILCSTTLAESDGFSVLAMLRQTPATAIIPSILFAADLTRSQLRKAMELGADDFLVEPFSMAELIQAIHTQISKQSTLEEWFANQRLSYGQAAPTPQPLPALKSVSQSNTESAIALAEPIAHTSSMVLEYPSTPPLNQVFHFIESNYHRSITLGDVAKAVGYSPAYLTNLTRRRTGQTIQQWIIERRMVAARRLLLETDYIVERIAAQVGYQHSVHFFRQFRQLHGTTPQNWRSHHRANP